MAENKNKKQVVEDLILRSPLLKLGDKKELISKLPAKSDDELGKMAETVLRFEEDLFRQLKESGLDMGEYQKRLKLYFKGKTEGLEKKIEGEELSDIENQLTDL